MRRRDVPSLVHLLGRRGRLLHPLLTALGDTEQHLAFGTLIKYLQPEILLHLLQLGLARPLDNDSSGREDGGIPGLREGDEHGRLRDVVEQRIEARGLPVNRANDHRPALGDQFHPHDARAPRLRGGELSGELGGQPVEFPVAVELDCGHQLLPLTRRRALAIAAPFVIRNARMLMPVRNRLLWRKKSLSGSNFTAWARLKQRLELLGALLLIVARHSSFRKAIFNKSEYDLAYFCNSVSDGHRSPVAVVLAFRCRRRLCEKSRHKNSFRMFLRSPQVPYQFRAKGKTRTRSPFAISK